MVARRLVSPEKVVNNAFDKRKKDVVLVLVELVEHLLNNSAMTADDFTPEVKQAYVSIRDIATRINPSGI